MKRIALFASLLISASVFAQGYPPADSIKIKKDTVRVPYPVIESTDTIPTLIVYCGKKPDVKYTYGYTLLKGYKDQSGNYITDPKPIAWIDDKGQPINRKVLMWYYDDKRKKEGAR